MTIKSNYYQKYIGKSRINIKSAVAGSEISCLLTYVVGETGIDQGGSLKILFRISADIPDVQFLAPKEKNYIQISSTNKNVVLQGYSRSNGAKGKIHERPWTNGFIIFVSGNHLSRGEKIFIRFNNWRTQTFLEDTFEFKIVVDPFATGKYIDLLNNPNIKILPNKPHKLVIIAPTSTIINEPFTTLIKLEDKWGNPCINTSGTIKIKQNKNFVQLPKLIYFSGGMAEFKAAQIRKGWTYIQSFYKKLSAKSNPIVTINSEEYKYYWADLHGQSEETVGTNSLNKYLSFAKKYAKLDIVCTQPNDFEVTSNFWRALNKLTKKYSEDNKFIAFPGYEWSGNTNKGGDRNVIYLEDNNPIFRSSHALLVDYSDINSDCNTVQDLFRKLRGKKALTLAHVGGRYANLSMHNDIVEKAVEVHSNWGTFEWFLFDALEKNYKVGIVANSDTHNGRPGASYPGLEDVFNAYGGLTCIIAKRLNRKTVFSSLKSRHFYATTGCRIYLSVKFFLDNKLVGTVGDKLISGRRANKISISSIGTTFIDKIEIFNKAKLLYTFHSPIFPKKKTAIKLTWSGISMKKGKDRLYKWNGLITIKNNEINEIETIQIYNNGLIKRIKNTISLDTYTSGNTQGLILKLNNSGGTCNLFINKTNFKIDLTKIDTLGKTIYFHSHLNKLIICKTSYEDFAKPISIAYALPESQLEKNNAIFVKVTQRDGHMAWSSPFFFQL